MNYERYEHPQIKFMKNIDPNLSSLEQFNLIRSYPWGGEQPQVDIFCELLKTINHDNPSIIELGSAGIGGSFYSALFEKWFDRKCTIINNDPRLEILQEIKTYWKDQHLTNAILCHGYVGTPKHYQASPDFDSETVPRLTVKKIMEDNNILKLDILHADIQGSEVSLCEEIVHDAIIKNIRYFFISTHSGENVNTYYQCLEIFNNNMNCKFHFSDPLKGGWGDGLIVVENNQF